MDQSRTPLFDALMNYREKQVYSFHVPGHKDGFTFNNCGKRMYETILSIDATEVFGLDDLYEPTEAIAESQNLLKDLYKTIKSYFLVNGSTVGNLVMILATCKAGDKVLVQRNCHKSVFNALKLARVNPVFLSPDIEETSLLPTGLKKELVQQALEKHADAKALVLTYPNYYGMARKDYREIIASAKRKGLLVLVDEAHGAHFILGSSIPPSTLEMGADIVIHSAHKTLPAMTMGSYLHINSKDVSIRSIEQTLQQLQTSSPSYPIMASLDLARSYLASVDGKALQRILDKIQLFKQCLGQMGYRILAEDETVHQDPFKMILCSESGGFQLQKSMLQEGIFPEMADPYHVLLTLAIDEQFPFNQVIQAFKNIQENMKKVKADKIKFTKSQPYKSSNISTLTIDFEEAGQLLTENIKLKLAVGRVAAQMVIPYPPGVPILIEGELVTKEHIREISSWQQVGARFQGLGEESLISVYKTH